MQATPATWRMLLDAGWPGDDRLRILCGGEALPRELANQLLAKSEALWNMYGPTETTIWSAVHHLESAAKIDSDALCRLCDQFQQPSRNHPRQPTEWRDRQWQSAGQPIVFWHGNRQ